MEEDDSGGLRKMAGAGGGRWQGRVEENGRGVWRKMGGKG